MRQFQTRAGDTSLLLTLYSDHLTVSRECPGLHGRPSTWDHLLVRKLGPEVCATEAQPQWIATDGPEQQDYLVSFWGGLEHTPEVAPRVDGTRWGVPLPVTTKAAA